MKRIESLIRRSGTVNLRDVGSTTLVDCLIMGLQLLTGVIVGRLLGPSGRGELAIIILWPAFLSGLIIGGLRFSVIYHVSRNIGTLASTIATAAVAMFCGSAVSALIIILLAERLLPQLSPDCHDLLILTSMLLPIASVGSVLEPLLLGMRDYRHWNLLRLLDPALMVGFVLALALLGRLSVAMLVYMFLGIRLAYTAWFLAFAARKLPSARIDRASKGLLVYGAKCLPSGWLGSINAQADQMILSAMFSPMYLGLYRTGANVASCMRFVFIGFQRLVMTEAAQFENESKRIDRITSYLASCMLVSSIAIVPFLMALGPAIRFLYGDQFSGSIVPAGVLVLAVVLRGWSGIIGNGFRGLGKPLLPLWADMIAAVLLITGFVLLIPRFGILGAAVALVISSAAMFVLLSCALLRCHLETRSGTAPGMSAALSSARSRAKSAKEIS